MSGTKPGFMIYHDKFQILDKLPDEQFHQIMRALYRYSLEHEEPAFDDWALTAIFEMYKQCIDADDQRYQARCKAAQDAVNTRWHKTKSDTDVYERIPTHTNGYEPIRTDTDDTNYQLSTVNNQQSTINDQQSSKRDKSRTAPRFKPPTLQEVTAYCQERGNKIDPQRFVDFYEAKGWRVGNTPMKDWKAAVRTWEQRDRNGPTFTGSQPRPNPALQYTQRQYTTEEANDVFADPSKFG